MKINAEKKTLNGQHSLPKEIALHVSRIEIQTKNVMECSQRCAHIQRSVEEEK